MYFDGSSPHAQTVGIAQLWTALESPLKMLFHQRSRRGGLTRSARKAGIQSGRIKGKDDVDLELSGLTTARQQVEIIVATRNHT